MPKRVEPMAGEKSLDEIGGYVSQERALTMLGTTSKQWLHDLTVKGKIDYVRWDARTLLYDKASIERYLTGKVSRRHTTTPPHSEEA